MDWHVDPLVILGIGVAALLYARGMSSLRERIDVARVSAFYGGLVTIFAALVSPLATLAERLFLAHMVQHLLLIMLAVPLLLLGGPTIPLLRGLPRALRSMLLRPFSRPGWAHPLLGLAANPVAALGIYVVLLSLWHLPALYDAAVTSAPVHVLQHVSFLAIGVLFWVQVIDPYPFHAPLRYPLRIVYLFVATAHNTVLGGILSFAEPTLYASYANLAERPFGISASADQQTGGVIMWVPGGMVHLAAISFVFAAWLNSEDRSGISSRPLPDHV